MNTVNIGIGATTMRDQLLYLGPIVTKFEPDAIVLFAGANDLAVKGNGYADRVVEMVGEYVTSAEQLLPGTVVYFVSINTAPSRAGNAPAIDKVNAAVAQMATTDGTLRYVETNAALLGADGKPDPSKFQADALHLNDAGYEVFGKLIEERLVADGFATSDCVFPDGTIAPDSGDGDVSENDDEAVTADAR
ncbi:GDSL-type esterase/lipase family protein [Microbacterium sp. YY-03]|uniref:GDSL-type esterase/lipase family protein n=1 Tax=Microbacterium sp. YY-03 TaxID=3421636 RepID=UPI003D1779D7